MNNVIPKIYQATLLDDARAFLAQVQEILSGVVSFTFLEWRRAGRSGELALLQVMSQASGLVSDRLDVTIKQSGFDHVLTFIREQGAGAFLPQEREQLHELSGHVVVACDLMQQWQLRRSAAAGSTNPEDDHGMGIVSLDGAIVSMESRFQEYIEQRLPAWDGRRLPFTLEVEPRMPISAMTWQGLFVRFDRSGADYHVRIRKDRRAPELTAREFDIAERIARGMTFKEIGRELNVAPSTVSTHLYNLYDKIGIRRRAELNTWLQRNGR